MNEDQYSKLHKYVQDEFELNRNNFVSINQQLGNIAKTSVNGFAQVEKALQEKADAKDLRQIYNMLDKISKQQEIDDVERLVIGHQLDRLDRWVHEVAIKVGHKLTV